MAKLKDFDIFEFSTKPVTPYSVYITDSKKDPVMLLVKSMFVVAYRENPGASWTDIRPARGPADRWLFRGWLFAEEVTALKLQGVI